MTPQRADSADIFIVLLGYIFMHVTFVNLFLKARKLGSNFWLGKLFSHSFWQSALIKLLSVPSRSDPYNYVIACAHVPRRLKCDTCCAMCELDPLTPPYILPRTIASTILISSIFAFIIGLPIANYLNVPVDIIGLSEALPFLVVTIGFDKPLRLARAVVEHPLLLPPTLMNGNAPRPGGMPRRKNKSASEIVLEAVSQVGPSIVRDYAAEVLVLLIGSTSGVGGLKEFCSLAALILVLDCVGLFSVYVAVLAIVVEVHFLATF